MCIPMFSTRTWGGAGATEGAAVGGGTAVGLDATGGVEAEAPDAIGTSAGRPAERAAAASGTSTRDSAADKVMAGAGPALVDPGGCIGVDGARSHAALASSRKARKTVRLGIDRVSSGEKCGMIGALQDAE
jgi:hypothetical protein